MWGDIILVSLIGAVISLDRTAAFQFMISRPIAAGPLIGLLLGRPEVGIIMGGFLEFIWINRPPLGGHLPPNGTLSSIVVTAGVILAGQSLGQTDRSLVVFGFLLTPPLARAGTAVEQILRRVNGRLAARAIKACNSGHPEKVHHLNLTGLVLACGAAFIYLLILVPVSILVLRGLYSFAPPRLFSALELMYLFIPLIGAAAALSAMNVKRSTLAYAIMFIGIFPLLSP